METLIKVLLSPMAFAVGFLWPLSAQTFIALELMANGWQVYVVTGLIALAFGLMAQIRGAGYG